MALGDTSGRTSGPMSNPTWRLISLPSGKLHSSRKSTMVSWLLARSATPRARTRTLRPFFSDRCNPSLLPLELAGRYRLTRVLASRSGGASHPIAPVGRDLHSTAVCGSWAGELAGGSCRNNPLPMQVDMIARVEGLLDVTQGSLSGRSRRSVTTWATSVKSASTLRQAMNSHDLVGRTQTSYREAVS